MKTKLCFRLVGGSVTGSCYVAQASLELEILLPHPPKCWDYRCILLVLARFCFQKKGQWKFHRQRLRHLLCFLAVEVATSRYA
jgi:hypothetical protein